MEQVEQVYVGCMFFQSPLTQQRQRVKWMFNIITGVCDQRGWERGTELGRDDISIHPQPAVGGIEGQGASVTDVWILSGRGRGCIEQAGS